jgi:SH3 domain-containing YSC84-like protein 1
MGSDQQAKQRAQSGEPNMKRHLVLLILIVILSLAAVSGNAAWASSLREDATQRLQQSADVLKAIASAPDKGIPDEVLKAAKCIVVIPNLLKAGLVVGGKYGHGVAVCRIPNKRGSAQSGWSAPAFITIGGGSLGPQIGAEGVDLVMVVMNDKGLQKLLSNKVRMSLEGSIAAGPVGQHATVGTDWKMDTEILTYARSKGAFAGQTLEGAVIEEDTDATKAIYGSDVPSNKILAGQEPVPAPAAPFLTAVKEITHEAADRQARQQASDRPTKMDHQK